MSKEPKIVAHDAPYSEWDVDNKGNKINPKTGLAQTGVLGGNNEPDGTEPEVSKEKGKEKEKVKDE